MKKNFINTTHLEGVLYEHDLSLKTTGPKSKAPGTNYIAGSLDIATDAAMTNIVTVYFSYVTATYKSGKANETFNVLNEIIKGTYGSYMEHGIEKAVKLRIDAAFGLNEFYTDENGQEKLVSSKRNIGSFVHKVDTVDADEKNRNTFKVDMIITGVTHVDGDDETAQPEKCVVKGAIFDFRGSLLPFDFTAFNPNAMRYFESLDASQRNPVCTCIWGRQETNTVVREIRTESAFGDDSVREVKSERRNMVITGAAKEPYIWDDPAFITATELTEALQKREIELAAMKKRQEEYRASKNDASVNTFTASIAAPAAKAFNF